MSERWTEIKSTEGNPSDETYTCDKCNKTIYNTDHYWIIVIERGMFNDIVECHYLHDKCYNTYEHYYGFNRPLD